MAYVIDELLKMMVSNKASDLHLTVGVPPTIRVDGDLKKMGTEVLYPRDTEEIVRQILDEEQVSKLKKGKEIDLCISRADSGRFRINCFLQRSSIAMAFRYVTPEIPDISSLKLPHNVEDIAKKTKGLFLVTGPTGSGKSTTLAAIIELINRERQAHIITLEDPIEYLHKHKKSIVNQREIGADTKSFPNALTAALREDPDVILIGEMRDLETISTALTAAETGHLVLATLHTTGAAKTIDRIIDIFPSYQQQQIRVQLAGVLLGVMSQVLVQKISGEGRVLAYEIMMANSAIKNLIRENKTFQILSFMQTNTRSGMITIDQQLIDLCQRGIISRENALLYCDDIEYVSKSI
ncbi:MAG: type IV pilus twitching motility protein PilT [Ignavibacteriales bacterium]